MNSSRIHDVVIAGGGPAGLSAALLLGRYMRDTVLCEPEDHEADSAASTGSYLGHDGCLPSELMRLGREQVAKFDSVTRLTAAVSDIQRTLTGFTVICGDGSRHETRSVLVVPKSVSLMPEIEGAKDFIGTSVHQFPCGDGWDHQGQKLGVMGCEDADAELAMRLLVWSPHVTLFCNGRTLSTHARQMLAENRILIETRAIAALSGREGKLQTVRLEDGSTMPCEALFHTTSEPQHSRLANRLGCDARRLRPGDAWLPDGGCGVQGAFFAGNPFKTPELAIIAAADGVKAAEEVNRWLSEAQRSYLAIRSA